MEIMKTRIPGLYERDEHEVVERGGGGGDRGFNEQGEWIDTRVD